MQLLLSFVKEPSDQAEAGPSSSPDVWKKLDAEQRSKTLSLLARLLAKAAAANTEANAATKRRDGDDD
jgi:hypothetical protein